MPSTPQQRPLHKTLGRIVLGLVVAAVTGAQPLASLAAVKCEQPLTHLAVTLAARTLFCCYCHH
eukprot:360465-Chlamydomonas_euryale.AAC.4